MQKICITSGMFGQHSSGLPLSILGCGMERHLRARLFSPVNWCSWTCRSGAAKPAPPAMFSPWQDSNTTSQRLLPAVEPRATRGHDDHTFRSVVRAEEPATQLPRQTRRAARPAPNHFPYLIARTQPISHCFLRSQATMRDWQATIDTGVFGCSRSNPAGGRCGQACAFLVDCR